jgi:hypothetical protein
MVWVKLNRNPSTIIENLNYPSDRVNIDIDVSHTHIAIHLVKRIDYYLVKYLVQPWYERNVIRRESNAEHMGWRVLPSQDYRLWGQRRGGVSWDRRGGGRLGASDDLIHWRVECGLH